jgi:hypothetical protein
MTDTDTKTMWDRYTLSLKKVPGTAITLIMVGILLPAAFHSFKLASSEATPSDLLVSICISLFSGILFLWILDAVSILPFRSQWVSKSVYGAAIISILGTSVAVYKDFFAVRKYPFEGSWNLVYQDSNNIKRANAIMMFSDQSGAYWGYSEFDNSDLKDGESIVWIKIDEFDPKDKEIRVQLFRSSKKVSEEKYKLRVERDGKLIASVDPNIDKLRLSRPN